jgi:hypothetical protein
MREVCQQAVSMLVENAVATCVTEFDPNHSRPEYSAFASSWWSCVDGSSSLTLARRALDATGFFCAKAWRCG